LLGGYLVIRLGLAPLSKMSDAVRQVSVKDFHLPLETDKLPNELQPIAVRLVELLGHLQKAFRSRKASGRRHLARIAHAARRLDDYHRSRAQEETQRR